MSDSDSDDYSLLEEGSSGSGVTLGFADGTLSSSKHGEESSSTDKLGGFPAFWPVCSVAPPSVDAATCRECSKVMPLLAQINAPLDPEQCDPGALRDEEDRMRVLYFFACVQKACMQKPGSLRAFRAIRRMPPKAAEPQQEASNPFSMSNAAASGGPFDLGGAIFGSSTAAAPADDSDSEDDDEGPPPPTNRWTLPDQAKLPAQYIATEPEPPASSGTASELKSFAEAAKSLSLDSSKPDQAAAASRRNSNSTSAKPENWNGEGYEVQQLPLGLDEVFLRFEERLLRGDAASQIMRYQRPHGQPLPFTAAGDAFAKLWKASSAEDGKRVYDESDLPPCDSCGAKRTFEVQLMPQLVSKVSESGLLKKREEEFVLGWATAWVFCCVRDCGLQQEGESEAWREEVVELQFEEVAAETK